MSHFLWPLIAADWDGAFVDARKSGGAKGDATYSRRGAALVGARFRARSMPGRLQPVSWAEGRFSKTPLQGLDLSLMRIALGGAIVGPEL